MDPHTIALWIALTLLGWAPPSTLCFYSERRITPPRMRSKIRDCPLIHWSLYPFTLSSVPPQPQDPLPAAYLPPPTEPHRAQGHPQYPLIRWPGSRDAAPARRLSASACSFHWPCDGRRGSRRSRRGRHGAGPSRLFSMCYAVICMRRATFSAMERIRGLFGLPPRPVLSLIRATISLTWGVSGQAHSSRPLHRPLACHPRSGAKRSGAGSEAILTRQRPDTLVTSERALGCVCGRCRAPSF